MSERITVLHQDGAPVALSDEQDPDSWLCRCGNTSHSQGFQTCSPTGTPMEPLAGSAWAGHYVCLRCTALISTIPAHDCWDSAVQYFSDGPLGHGWECGRCGNFLQAG